MEKNIEPIKAMGAQTAAINATPPLPIGTVKVMTGYKNPERIRLKRRILFFVFIF